ncbi:hypothetical protein CBW65_23135 [Tumebacillus avium]|uniref:CAAX prenyl protease 2/Lysostaphin resistance protein A-like domain-containing protein n=1 Tax=Tumebacillus avium TaxID=1903704 RepID=A0A1Y0IST4_9BACL|nr:CPBP family intramembrane glutamic endopeptidase [Tumebacillus avium]ARU63581.1 hypothetical protein CBW65_23135 [Tumebacillus avium]
MVRKMRSLLLLGLIGLALMLCELFWVQAMQHTPLPAAVTPAQAKTTAALWLGDAAVTLKQEENSAVSRYLHERKMTEAFRKEAADANKPLVMWKVKSGDSEVLVNRQNGRVEGVRGMTLALFPGTAASRTEQVRQELIKRFSLQSLSVSSINNVGVEHVLLSFETGYQYDGLREVIHAELYGDQFYAFEHRLEVAASSGTEDLGAQNTSKVENAVRGLTMISFTAVAAAIVLTAFYQISKWGVRGQRMFGEALISVSMLVLYWLINPTLAGLITGFLYGMILFGVFVITAPAGLPMQSPDERTSPPRPERFVITLTSELPLQRRWVVPHWPHQQIIAGYGVFGVLAGASTILAWVAAQAGFWFSDLRPQEALALSPWPVLLTGVAAAAAAINEELIFRRLGNFVLNRLLKSWIAAAILSSLVWSMGHLTYDVSPWYYRILELGLVIGPLFFWLYRRYGLGAVITGHFLYNCFLANVALAGAFGNYWGFLWLLLPGLVFALNKKGLRI